MQENNGPGNARSLLNNLPVLTFSKDAETGVYLACNQLFAEYAHKETPEGVVGLTDFEIFDPVTAAHFVEDDRKTLSMDEPYIFYEDVPDAAGFPRHFQTTKQRFTDSTGRLCTLGLCVDVSKMLEEQNSRHEEIQLREKKLREQQAKLITAIASDYRSVYYIDLDRDEGFCYQTHPDIENGVEAGGRFQYYATFKEYAEKYVAEKYRNEFLDFIQPDTVREGLKKEMVISYRYVVQRNGRNTYEMLKFAGVRHPEDRDDHLVHAVGACFADVDAETRKTMEHSEALSAALSAAEQANRAKTAFLSNMSHEIRTPMNAIIGLNNIAMSDQEISDKTREYLDKIGISAKHLLNIINDILDMSRIESGRMSIKKEEFSFSRMLEQINTIISGQCREKDINYECRINGHINDYYIGDVTKLRQVLINILGNAVKFTPSGGSVSFIIEVTAAYGNRSNLLFTVRDTGIGMSSEYLPHIFDAFSQEDSSATNTYGSTGLGMPITKSIVELMNGTIDVVSEKGKGTQFTVNITLTDSDYTPSGEEHEDITPHELGVLVIDDDPIACEHASLVMGQVGVRCDSALSGAEGIEKIKVKQARRDSYDLILVDWKMPEMDGVETTRRIREISGNDTAIIILTSYNWDDVADEAREAGVDSFVSKPLFAGTVLDEFREAFKKKSINFTAEKTDLCGRRILLAEDMDVNAEIMVMVLGMKEMDVDVAVNGKEALGLFSASPEGYYDAVLMDVRMPVMDGLEASKRIRALERRDAGTVPIIALTANAFDEDVQNSMQAGLNAHLSKPVEPEALFETLESLIKDY